MRLVVGDELRQFLVLPRNISGAPRVRVERWLRHLRPQLIEATAKRCKIGKFFHETRSRAAICELRAAAGCGLIAPIVTRGEFA
jgi:hypothetical protein